MSDASAMYGSLLRAHLNLPTAVARAAYAAARSDIDGVHVLGPLAMHRDTPIDILTELLAHENESIRREVLGNPAVPIADRRDAIAREESGDVLDMLAGRGGPDDLLVAVAARAAELAVDGRSPSVLIANVADSRPDVAACLVRSVIADPAITAAFDSDDSNLPHWFTRAATRAGLVDEVVPYLTDAPTLLHTIIADHPLSPASWAHIDERIVTPAASTRAGGDDPAGPEKDEPLLNLLTTILWLEGTPGPIRHHVLDVLTGLAPDHPLVEAAHAAGGASKLTGEPLVAFVARTGAETARVLAAVPLPGPARAALAANPNCPSNVLYLVMPDQVTADVVAALFTGQSTRRQVALCRLLGPDVLPHLGGDGNEVLVHLLNSSQDRIDRWAPHVMRLPDPARLSLTWQAAIAAASVNDAFNAWVTARVAATLTSQGRARLFNEIAPTFPGTVGELLHVLAVATDPPAAQSA